MSRVVAASAGEALRAAAVRLRAAGSRSPRLDAELLLATALGVERVDLLREPERELTASEAWRLESLVRRRQGREPVAYILGRRAFRTIVLEVTPAVLIPRPETETLVDVALETIAAIGADRDGRHAGTDTLEVLDVGTGSGCVALALAAEDPRVRALGVDVCAAAVEVARRNAARHGLGERVDFACGDLFDPVAAGRRFDLVVSNPPYVPDDEHARLEPNVRDHEPAVALRGGADGLDICRRLVSGAAAYVRSGGALAVEVGAGQAASVSGLFAAAGVYASVRVRDDLGGVPRVVWAARRD